MPRSVSIGNNEKGKEKQNSPCQPRSRCKPSPVRDQYKKRISIFEGGFVVLFLFPGVVKNKIRRRTPIQ